MNSISNNHIIVRDDGFHMDDHVESDFIILAQLKKDVSPHTCIHLSNDEDMDELRQYFTSIKIIRIHFPDFADGRGFSQATRLRQLGFRGRLRATGHLIADQYRLARLSGFDEIAISVELAARQPEHHWLAQAKSQIRSYQDHLISAA